VTGGAAWNLYSEAGVGLASEVVSYYKNTIRDNSQYASLRGISSPPSRS